MKLKIIMGDEHLSDCQYGQADGPDDFIKECDCMLDDTFAIYFAKKYPYHMATIAYKDKEVA